MSAIFGRVELNGASIDRGAFLRAFAMTSPLGADLADYCIEGPAAVGHRLLRISAPLPNSPLQCTDGVMLVADAVLDNREDLRHLLGASALDLTELSDSELIAQAFRRWGPNCVDKLIGDFAFAVIKPERREVFLTRDHIGARPLFWALRDRTFLFGTSICAIVSDETWRWPIDERVVAEYLLNPSFPVSKPFFQHVARLAPGSCLTLQNGQVRLKSWWKPSIRARRADDPIAKTKMLLEQAVRDRVASQGEVGSHFSGGLDSTSVAVLASRTLREQGRELAGAYAWSPDISDTYPPAQAKDERLRLRSLAQLEDVPVSYGAAGSINFLNFLERPIEFEGEADLADEIPVLEAARADHLRILLSGWGGDEAFSAHGHGFAGHLLLRGKLAALSAFVRAPPTSVARPKFLLGLVWRELLSPMLPDALYRFADPFRSKDKGPSLISGRLRAKHRALVAKRSGAIKFNQNPNANLKRHVTAGHLTMRMETWAAWSAPYGFQYRYPLTDRRLLEFLFTLPPDQLFLNNQARGLARAVVESITNLSAAKLDLANEALRRDTREAVWRALAEQVRRGDFAGECPWLDMNAFRAAALSPADQSESANIGRFADLFAAVRVWFLYRRALDNKWI